MIDGIAKLADFGLSVFAGEYSKSFHSLRGGVCAWQAPELVHPELFDKTSIRPTKQSDVYSFAMVCCEVRRIYQKCCILLLLLPKPPSDLHR